MFDSKLNSLLVLSATNSITKTAEIVHHTQPSVTSQIKNLEEEYGITIFYKKGNGIIITPEGKLLVEHAKRIKAEYNYLQKEIENFKLKLQTVKIGVTSGMGSSFISSVLAQFSAKRKKENANFKVVLIYDSSTRLLDKLLQNEISCIITDDDIKDDSLEKIQLDKGKLLCLTSPNHELAKHKNVSLDDLKQYELLIRLPSTNTQILFDALLRSKNMSIKDFNILLELNSISAIKSLVMKNQAIAILPSTSCFLEISNKKLVGIPIVDVSAEHSYNIFYRSDFSHKEFVDEIFDFYKQLKEGARSF